MNVSLPDATAYNSKQLAIQKDMTPSLYAMFFKVTYNVPLLVAVAKKSADFGAYTASTKQTFN